MSDLTLSRSRITKLYGMTYHYFNGKLHRLDGPAMVSELGYQAWFQNGIRHRINKPAVIVPPNCGFNFPPIPGSNTLHQYWYLWGSCYREEQDNIDIIKRNDFWSKTL